MKNKERIERINELKVEIQPLKYEQTLIRTKLYLFNNAVGIEENEKTKLESRLSEIDKQLQPLIEELRSKQVGYLVHYDVKFKSPTGKFTESYKETLYLSNDYDIDTEKNGWQINNNDSRKQALLKEIVDFIYYYRYSNFTILSIKKLSN